jgi:hypothetical protein
MREIVTKEWLRAEINRKMVGGWDMTKFWTSVEPRRRPKPQEGELNWRYSFNPGAVPAGFEKKWEAIRQKFEDAYNISTE